MTENEKYIKEIMQMTIHELLDAVMESPEYLTDSYYSVFGTAMTERYGELRKEK
ncbi:MAG: hypothetical protein GY714_20040 [Desulfobacterales bacterium]|nr:hypothetical protein [Desulfobacterales bacterium]